MARKVQLSWDDLLLDAVDAHAALIGVSRSEWLRLAAQHVIDHRVKLVERRREPEVEGCAHPKDRRLQVGYGTICGLCRDLLR